MDVVFSDKKLAKVETDPDEDGGFPQATVRAYRKRMQFIRAANDERDFYSMKSLHFEKLKRKTVASTIDAIKRTVEADLGD